ncbi:MAG: TetR/AcrR family transcriptional regulator [Solirubrobacterales bacterium]|nr:TetR/AcrR family transcriptional regulator [Solirubrobacterales bacterium]
MTEVRQVVACGTIVTMPGVTRRDRVLEAAATLFHERGFHGVGIDEIGKTAGTNGPAIYRDFSGKDELLAVLFEGAIEKVAIPAGVRFEDPRTELEFLVRHHAEFAIGNLQLVSIYAHEHRALAEPWRSEFEKRTQKHGSRWRRTIAACYPGASRQDVAIAAHAAIGMLHSVVFWPETLLRSPAVVDRLCAMVLEGIGSMAQSSTAAA